MNIKYYSKDIIVGLKDEPYFEIEIDDEDSPTGKKFVPFRLVSIDDQKVMPEFIHEYIATNEIETVF